MLREHKFSIGPMALTRAPGRPERGTSVSAKCGMLLWQAPTTCLLVSDYNEHLVPLLGSPYL